jgi:hypothetical protein
MISKTFSVILIEVARAPDTAERAGVKPPSKGIVVCDGSFESTVVGDSSSSAIGCGPVASAFPRRQRCDVLSMVNPHARQRWVDGGAEQRRQSSALQQKVACSYMAIFGGQRQVLSGSGYVLVREPCRAFENRRWAELPVSNLDVCCAYANTSYRPRLDT